MNNQKRKLLLIAVVLVVAFGLVYYSFLFNGTREEATDPTNGEVQKMGIDFTNGPHPAPLGEINPDLEDSDFVFGSDEQLGLAGKYRSEQEKEISVNLLSGDKDLLERDFLSGFTTEVTETPDGLNGEQIASTEKSFSVCCAGTPEEPGEYYLELITNSSRLELVPFEVVE